MQLPPRQEAIARLISQGLSNKEIADRLGIKTNTVNGYIHMLMLRLRARNRAQIVAIVLSR